MADKNENRFTNAPMVWSGTNIVNPDGDISTYAPGDNPTAYHENYFRYETYACILELQNGVGAVLADPDSVTSGVLLGGYNEGNTAGELSVVGGQGCTVTGDLCTAIGLGLTSSYELQTVFGAYNEEDEDAVFMIGDGVTPNERHNLLVVKRDGTIYVNGEEFGGGSNPAAHWDTTSDDADGTGAIVANVDGAVASGTGAVALGYAGAKGAYSIAGAAGYANGKYGAAFSGGYAQGQYATGVAGGGAYGQYSFAAGNGAKVGTGGQNSIAIGYGSTSETAYSFTFGFQCDTQGQYGTAIGYEAKATTMGAMAFGYEAQSDGMEATAIGYGILISYDGATAIGKYNEDVNAPFMVGIGTSDGKRKNGLVIDSGGNGTFLGDVCDGAGTTIAALLAEIESLKERVTALEG